jgi:hypothetical protein
MRTTCHEIRVEIATRGGGELTAELKEHIERCEACERFLADTVTIATAVSPESSKEISPAAATAMARRALANQERRKLTVWMAPLLSASATAAALIVYFGLVTPTLIESSEETTGPAESSQSSNVGVLTPTIPSASVTDLPESLSALRTLIVTTENEGEEL